MPVSSHALTVLHQRTSNYSIHSRLSAHHQTNSTGVFFYLPDLVFLVFWPHKNFIFIFYFHYSGSNAVSPSCPTTATQDERNCS